jgi:dTDP-4-amino-4,6-dideoxygalactose transaminase
MKLSHSNQPAAEAASMEVRFMDLRITDPGERRRLLEAFERMFDHGQFLHGPELFKFEKKFSRACGRRFAVGVGSGTQALYLALRGAGVGKGDEVIMPALSWIATANAVAMTGARPVFCDINEDLNMDPRSAAELVGPRTRVLLPVHYTGKVAPMDDLMALAEARGLTVIEDAAQAYGAVRGGRVAGSFGLMGCFSLNPMKTFASLGEAGMIVFDDESLLDRLSHLRYNGMQNKLQLLEPSLNFRMDTLQAAVLLERMRTTTQVIRARRRLAKIYDRILRDVVELPVEADNEKDIYYTYTIRCDRRDELKEYLSGWGIETQVHHPLLMPAQPPYRLRGWEARVPAACRLVRQVLCLPLNEKLTEYEVKYVASAVRRFFGA